MNDRNSIIKDIDKAVRLLVSIRRRIILSEQAGGRKAGGRRKAPREYPTTTLGRNIDRLRLELGWSYDDLARVSGISKKRILDHVNKGTRPWPHVLKEYSDTFTKAFGRPISVADLLTEM
ncbi:MAG: helix-turn-helix transcriptional regulator [Acidobacteria bacterium]|nr:helix-turn-helix transcriptional regulator [Acidobacteriota bacterium]